jgi:hypothetical protein
VTPYELVLVVHSAVRWAVVVLLVALTARSFAAWRARRDWTGRDERLHVAVVAAVDLQLTLGLLLYLVLSPLPRALFADFALGMKQPPLRFFGLEHGVTMLLAIALIHGARARSKRAATGPLRHRRVWTAGVVALLLVALAIPWPGTRHGRPLLRGAQGSART